MGSVATIPEDSELIVNHFFLRFKILHSVARQPFDVRLGGITFMPFSCSVNVDLRNHFFFFVDFFPMTFFFAGFRFGVVFLVDFFLADFFLVDFFSVPGAILNS